MSSRHIFSAMGFYPVNPASGEYVIGTPAFNHCTLNLSNGKEFHIEAPRKSPSEFYVRSIQLNGQPLKGFILTHKDIVKGGTMVFKMKK